MKKILFAKYNRTRRDEYQLSTIIYKGDYGYYVEKMALNQKALQHIHEFKEKYQNLEEIYTNMKLLKPTLIENGVVFNYIEGETVDLYLMKSESDINSLVVKINNIISKVYQYNTDAVIDFFQTESFVNVFGDIGDIHCKALKITNIDAIFDNIMIQGDEIYCLDYEWVFDFPIPIDFSIYRSLLYFYNKYYSYFSSFINIQNFIEKFGFSLEKQEVYWSMEEQFQQYVQGNKRCYIYTNNYKKKIKTFDELLNTEKAYNEIITQLELKDNHIRNLESMLNNDYSNLITEQNKQLELQIKLKDNHINNIENMITAIKISLEARQQEIDQLKENIRLKDNHIDNLENLLLLKENHIEYQDNQLKVKSEYINVMDETIKKAVKNPIYGIAIWIRKKLNKE
jgi:O-antigen biosynthesis protein